MPDFDDEVVAGVLRHPTRDAGGLRMTDGIDLLTIFVLAVFVGFEVVSKVSISLHTPLMSGANAIHGVILVGAIIVTGQADSTRRASCSGCVAVVLATVNMVGGFVVTDRMLEMFGRDRPGRHRAARRRRTTRERPVARPSSALGLPGRRRLLHPRAQGPVVARRPRAAAT